MRGDFSAAYRRVAEAVELDPDNVRARYLLTSFAERLE
jgi:Flp pilus assembly protein TadD